jgi:hypothetical protein
LSLWLLADTLSLQEKGKRAEYVKEKQRMKKNKRNWEEN